MPGDAESSKVQLIKGATICLRAPIAAEKQDFTRASRDLKWKNARSAVRSARLAVLGMRFQVELISGSTVSCEYCQINDES